MITISKNTGAPEFGSISEFGPVVLLSEAGNAISDAIFDIGRRNPSVSLLRHVVMPDHIHFVIHVKERLSRPLGVIIQKFKANATHELRRRLNDPDVEPFRPNFHDRILRAKGQLDVVLRYVEDNPRRLWIKKRNPDLFRRINHLNINGIEFLAFGNMFLLRDFDRYPVMVHRSLTSDEKRRQREEWVMAVRSGGVLVSPFISAEEKEIRDLAISEGGRLIMLSQESVGERFKPPGRLFDLCAMGRLLMLFPWADRVKNSGVDRTEALRMNRMAELICSAELSLKIVNGSADHGR